MRRILIPLLIALCCLVGATSNAFASIPTTQAKGVYFTGVGENTMTVKWTKGNGVRRLVVARESEAPNVDALGEDYGGPSTADAVFGSGSDIDPALDAATYVVYNGTGNSVTVTGLDPGTLYYFMVLEYNFDGSLKDIQVSTASNNPRSKFTTPATPVAGALQIGHNMANIPWSYSGNVNYFEFELTTDDLYTIPVGDYDNLDVGTDAEFAVSGLDPGTTYYYRVRAVVEQTCSAWLEGSFATDANAAPVIGGLAAEAIAYAENDGNVPVSIASALTITDANQEEFNNEFFSAAQVTITNNPEAGDVLSAVMPDNIAATAVYNAATFTLSIAPTGDDLTLEEMRAALRAVKFSNTSDNPTDNVRTITIAVADYLAGAGGGTVDVDVDPVNDSPELSSDLEGAVNYLEADVPSIVISDIAVTDAENNSLVSATVTITSGADVDDELSVDLALIGMDGVATASYDENTHILSIAPLAPATTISLANMQTILQNVKFFNPDADPVGSNRVVSFKVDDGQAFDHESDAITRTINFILFDDPPTYELKAEGGYLATNEDVELEITFQDLIDIGDIVDPDTPVNSLLFRYEDALMGGVVSATSGGAQIANGTEMAVGGRWYFRPEADIYGDAVASFDLSLGGDGNFTAPVTIPVHINAVNDAPTMDALPALAAVNEDGDNISVTVSGLSEGLPANEDAQTMTLTYSLTPLTGNIAAATDVPIGGYDGESADYTFEFNPADNEWGTATLVVTVTDDGGTANGGVNSFSRSTTITINEENDDPTFTAAANPAAVEEDGDNIEYALSDIDEGGAADENDQQIVITITGSTNEDLAPLGAISYVYDGDAAGDNDAAGDAVITVDPAENEFGAATISYTVSDGTNVIPGSFDITVNAVNDAPTAITGVPASLDEEKADGFVIGTLGATDVDEGQTYAYTIGGADAAYVTLGGAGNDELRVNARMNYEDGAFADHELNITVSVENTGVNPVSTTFGPVAFNIALNDVNEAPTLTAISSNFVGLQDKWIEVTYASLVARATGLDDIDAFDPNESLKFRIKTISDGWTVKWSKTDLANVVADSAIGSAEGRVWVKGPLDTWGTDMVGFTIVAWDGSAESAPAVDVKFDITDNNDAPVWSVNAGDYGAFAVMYEDATVLAGNVTPTLISALIGSGQTDVDANPEKGLGIRSFDNTNGVWQYTLNGATWLNLADAGAFSDDNVLNMGSDGNNALRFVPNPNFSGSTSITAYAWDQTNEDVDDGEMADPTPNGLDYAYSTTTHTWNFDISDMNDAPTLSNLGGEVTFTENGAALTLDADATISDIDVPALTTAAMTNATLAVTITHGAEADDDLRVAAANGLTWASGTELNYNGTKVADLVGAAPFNFFTLTFTANATPEALNAILHSVTYVNAGDGWDFTDKEVTFTYNDNGGSLTAAPGDVNESVSGTVGLTIVPVNDAPTFDNIADVEIDEDNGLYSFGVTGIDEGGAGAEDDQAVVITTSSDNQALIPDGSISIADLNEAAGTATLSFTPLANAFGTAHILVTVTDDGLGDAPDVNTYSQEFTVTVNPINDAPVLTAVGAPLAAIGYGENGAAVTIIPDFTITDVDDTDMESLYFAINTISSQDEITYDLPDGITATEQDNLGKHEIIFNGNATIADYEALMESIKYRNTSDKPAPLTREFEFTINDGDANSAVVTRDLNITPTNDAPEVEVSTPAFIYNENDGAVAINIGASIEDSDDDNLSGAVITLTNFHGDQDVVDVTPAGSVTVASNAGGVITLTGSDTKAAYEGVINSLTYENTSDNPNVELRGFTLVVTDDNSDALGAEESDEATFAVDVNEVNDAPTDITFDPVIPANIDENSAAGAMSIDLGVADLESATQHYTYTLEGANANKFEIVGSTLTNKAGINYETDETLDHTLTITVKVTDDGTDAGVNSFAWTSETFDITINNVNDVPTLTGDSSALLAHYWEGAPAVALHNALTISDEDAGSTMTKIRASFVSGFVAGQDELSATFGVKFELVRDGLDGSIEITPKIGETPTTAEWQAVARTVNFKNTSGHAVINPDRVILLTIFDNGVPDPESISVSRTVRVHDLNSTPVLETGEADQIAFVEEGGAQVILPNLTVADLDDKVVAATVWVSSNAAEGDVLSMPAMAGMTATYDADTYTLTINADATVDDPANMQAALRTVEYSNVSNSPSTLVRTISFRVDDGEAPPESNLSNIITNTASVEGTNDAPTLTVDNIAFTEDGEAAPFSGAFTEIDFPGTDLSGHTLTINQLEGLGDGYEAGDEVAFEIGGHFGLFGGTTLMYDASSIGSYMATDENTLSFTFNDQATPAMVQELLGNIKYENENHAWTSLTKNVSFAYSDGIAADATSTAIVTITPVNEAPDFTFIDPYSVDEDAAMQTVQITGIHAGGEEGDYEVQTLTLEVIGITPNAFDGDPTVTDYNPAMGTANLNFKPAPDFYGAAEISLGLVDDGTAGAVANLSTSKNLHVVINPINDAPTDIALSNATFEENDPNLTIGTLTSADVDGPTAIYSISAGGDNFEIVDGNKLALKQNVSFETVQSLDVTLQVADAGAPEGAYEEIFTVTITNAPEAPTAIQASADDFDENLLAGTTVATLNGEDEDAGQAATLAFSLVDGIGSADNADFEIAGNALKITTSPNFEAKNTYSVRVRATDADMLTYDEALTFTVNDVNEAPTALNVTDLTPFYENNLDRALVADIETIDEDAGETITYSFDAPNAGLFEVENGHLYFTGSADFETKPSYTVIITATDVAAHSITADAVTINVLDVNEDPTLADIDNVTINEDAALQTVDLAGITAGPGETQGISISAVSSDPALIPNPATVYVSPDATGSITFTPVANANGAATVTVRVTDDGGTPADNTDDLFVEKSFQVAVNAVNDIPAIDPILNVSVDEDSDPTIITLSGISAGMPNEEGEQTVEVTATSDNPGLFSQFDVSYADGDATGTLTIKPAADAFGTAHVTVTVTDGMPANNAIMSLFDITVNPVNDAPTMDAIAQFTDGYKNEVYEITYDELKEAANEADVDDETINFLYSGGLNGLALQIKKSGSDVTEDAVADVTTIETGDILYWTPPTDAINVTNAFNVRATDGEETSGEVMVVVDINHYYYAPTDITLSNMTIDENVANGYEVATLTTTDVDLGDTFTYTLVAGEGSEDNAKFSISGDKLLVNGDNQIDFETLGALHIRLRTTDSYDATYEEAVTLAVNDRNDAPTLTASALLEGGLEDAGHELTYEAIADALSPQDQDAGASISFRVESVVTGTLTKGGSPVVAGVTTLAPGETLIWTPALNANGPAIQAFTVKAYDGAAYSDAGRIDVAVAAENDKPVLANLESGPQTFNWDDHQLTGVALTSAITITDPEDVSITQAEIKLLGDAFLPGDELSFTNTANIVGSWSANARTLTLTGSDLLASYVTALRAVKFKTTNNRTADFTVEFKVSDGALWSDAATRALKVVRSLAPQPTVQTTNLAITNVRSARMRLSWTKGNGAKRIILVREGAAVAVAPADGVDYLTQNSTSMDWNSAETIAPNTKVIFNGTATGPLTITGLNSNAAYHFAAFEYNTTGGAVNYLTTNPGRANASTTKAATQLVVQNYVDGDILQSGSTFDLNLQLQDETGAPAYPTSDRTFSLSLGGAKYELSVGSPTSVSFTQDETTKSMTGLSYTSKYGDANVTLRLDDGPGGLPTATRAIDVRAAKPISTEAGYQLTFQPVAGANLNVKWTVRNPAEGVRYLLVTKQGTADGAPTFVPEDGHDYPANTDYEAAATYTDSYKAIYDGVRTDNNWQLVSNIPQNRYFRWKLYTYYGDTEDATTYSYNTLNAAVALNKTDLLKAGSDAGVELASLNASSFERKVSVSWQTLREPNVLGFELYRANEGEYDSFELIGSYSSNSSLASTGLGGGSYRFLDADPNLRAGATYIYKLAAVAGDGTREELGLAETAVLEESRADAGLLVAEISPNPVVDKVTTYFTLSAESVVTVELFDMAGNRVKIPIEGKSYKAGERHAISFTMPLEAASGQYLLSVTAGSEGVIAPFMYVK